MDKPLLSQAHGRAQRAARAFDLALNGDRVSRLAAEVGALDRAMFDAAVASNNLPLAIPDGPHPTGTGLDRTLRLVQEGVADLRAAALLYERAAGCALSPQALDAFSAAARLTEGANRIEAWAGKLG